jgi:hypothetical protein
LTPEHLRLREQFKFKRLGYYQAGRFLAFSGVGINSYNILLGYAIEMHLKAAIAELEFQGLKLSNSEVKLLYKHELKNLFYLGKKYGLFKNIKVSDYFLELAENFLHTRYPSQENESRNKIEEKSYNITICNIFPYDDLICQIDKELSEIAGNENDSIIILAAKYINTSENINLFHCNAFGLNILEPIWQKLLKDNTIEQHHHDILKHGKEHIWRTQNGLFVPYEMYDSIVKNYNCNDFRLKGPKIEIDENGKQTWTMSFDDPVGLH